MILSFECSIYSEENVINIKENNQFIGKYHLINEPFCEKCSLPLDPENQICDNCWGIEYYFDAARTVGLYFKMNYEGTLSYITKPKNDILSKHIRFLKNSRQYSYNINWAKPLGKAIALCINNRFTEFKLSDIIIPVPQHQHSIDRRGYNQAEEIAKVACKELDMELRPDILYKAKDINMRDKNLEERREIVIDAYQSNTELNDETVLLIDDTLTTGSNLNECARILKNIGAQNVYAMVAGRDVFEY